MNTAPGNDMGTNGSHRPCEKIVVACIHDIIRNEFARLTSQQNHSEKMKLYHIKKACEYAAISTQTEIHLCQTEEWHKQTLLHDEYGKYLEANREETRRELQKTIAKNEETKERKRIERIKKREDKQCQTTQ